MSNQNLKIFLASSSELKKDREQFEIFINRQNNKYIQQGIFLKLVIWEDFLDAMSTTRLQDEYNKAIEECDVVVSLFKTKVGQYTEEEVMIAWEAFKKNNKPLIYTYFKEAQIKISQANIEHLQSLKDFQKKLSELGHFYTTYKNIEDLKYKFSEQLNKFLPELIEIENNPSNTTTPDSMEEQQSRQAIVENNPNNTTRPDFMEEQQLRQAINAAIICGVTIIITAIIGIWQPWKTRITETELAVRVADPEGKSVKDAKVSLMLSDEPAKSDYSDSNGTVNLSVNLPGRNLDTRLIVETNQYQVFERNLRLPTNKPVNVRLQEPDPEAGSVIVRVVNAQTNKTVFGAEVVLLNNGDIHRQATDSFGITKFPLQFPDGKAESRISIETGGYKTNDQRVTLLPNRVQDVRLDPESQTIEIVPIYPELTRQQTPTSNEGFTSLTFRPATSEEQSLLTENNVGLDESFKILVSRVDLNGDKKDEIVASHELDSRICGNRGCLIYVVQETSPGKWKTIFSLLGWLDLNVRKSRVNGYYEISRPAGRDNIELVWTFNGIEYEQSHYLHGSYKIQRILPERTATATQATPLFLQPSLSSPSPQQQVQLGQSDVVIAGTLSEWYLVRPCSAYACAGSYYYLPTERVRITELPL